MRKILAASAGIVLLLIVIGMILPSRPQVERDILIDAHAATIFARLNDFKRGSGLPVKVPVIDMVEIGSGGGSLAEVDERGLIRVGPRSAGADPGPACYGKGGRQPTATDALVVLGRIRAENFLGGQVQVQRHLAEEAVQRELCQPLGVDLDQAALGAVQILTHSMIEGIEISSVQKGYDPRDFALVAAGGAGPLFACDIAQELHIPKILVPRYPGITSALGLLATDIVYEFVATEMQLFSTLDRDKLTTDFAVLEKQAIKRLQVDGMDADQSAHQSLIRRIADCRYVGQGYELQVEFPDGGIDEAALAGWWRAA